MGVEWGVNKNAGRQLPGQRPTSARLVTGRDLFLTASRQRRGGEGPATAHQRPLPNLSRRQVHLSPYAAYLAALSVICGA